VRFFGAKFKREDIAYHNHESESDPDAAETYCRKLLADRFRR
jgi:hypothetical protein